MPQKPSLYEEPLSAPTCRNIVRQALFSGTVSLDFWDHARLRMSQEGMVEDDVLNILKGGRVIMEKHDFKDGLHRYVFATHQMWVAIALPDICWKSRGELPDIICVITCHRGEL